jgi:hypothetical protein
MRQTPGEFGKQFSVRQSNKMSSQRMSGAPHSLNEVSLGLDARMTLSSVPQPPVEQHASIPPAVKEQALVNARQLRRQVMFSFSDYQEAYNVFQLKQPKQGIGEQEWRDAMPYFGFTSAPEWELTFGHMIEWQSMRWDPRFRGTEGRVTLSSFASSLDRAAPCETPLALRKLLQERFEGPGLSSMQKAWLHLSEGGEEVSLGAWRHALQMLGVTGDDAAYVFAILKAVPILERSRDFHSQDLTRANFMAAMRVADSVTRFLDVFLCLQQKYGVVCRPFEVHVYPHELLLPVPFEEQLVAILGITVVEARTIFSLLDFHQDGVVAIDDVLDAFTAMQLTYLPHHRLKESEPVIIAELPISFGGSAEDVTHRYSSPHRFGTISSVMDATPITQADLSQRLEQRCSSSMSSATVTPSDIQTARKKVSSSAASGSTHIHNVSTTLPFSDSEDSDGFSDEDSTLSRRPHSSMAVAGDAARKSAAIHSTVREQILGSGAKRKSKAKLANLSATAAPFLPHLDLAAASRRSSLKEAPSEIVGSTLPDQTMSSGIPAAVDGDELRRLVADEVVAQHASATMPSMGPSRRQSVDKNYEGHGSNAIPTAATATNEEGCRRRKNELEQLAK